VRFGCLWRYLPADLPPWQTVYWYFSRWEDAGVTEKLLAALRNKARVQQGREGRTRDVAPILGSAMGHVVTGSLPRSPTTSISCSGSSLSPWPTSTTIPRSPCAVPKLVAQG
jgi:hypothetical protein